MALILLWLGGLSFAGSIVWADVSGFSTHTGLAMLATAALGFIGFKGLDVRRRLETLSNLGWAYFVCGVFAYFIFIFVIEFKLMSAPLPWWSLAFLCIGGFGLGMGCRRRMKRAGLLFDLRRVSSLPGQAGLQENIKCEGYEVATGFSQYGPSTSQRGRIFLEHEAQLPCVIRAKAGSVSVYEIPAYMSWIARKGSLWRESYLHNPFSVPKRIKPTSHVQQALLRDLAELVASLKVMSKELKGRVIEVTPDRTSVLLKKYELTPEELGGTCDALLRVASMIDDYVKRERGG